MFGTRKNVNESGVNEQTEKKYNHSKSSLLGPVITLDP
jgi:hypothetical protein